MPALIGEPWKGAAIAEVFTTLDPSNRTLAYVTTTVGSPEPTTDQGIWEGNPGDSLTLRFKWTSTDVLLNGQQAPNFATVEVRLPSGAAVISSWSVAFPGQNTEVTRLFHFDNLPLNEVLGSLRSGMLELYLNWGSAGGLAPWNADSRADGDAGILGVNAVNHARGYVRSPLILNSHSISNMGIAGAEPSSFASPDPIHTRLSWTADTYRSQTQTLSLRRSGGAMEREEALANTTANRDFSWTGTTGNNRRIGNGIFLGSEAKDLRVDLSALDFGGDNEYIVSQASTTPNVLSSVGRIHITRPIGNQSFAHGLGVVPKLLILMSDSLGDHIKSSFGAAMSSTSRWVISQGSEDNAFIGFGSTDQRSDRVWQVLLAGGGINAEADFVSFDATNFTINKPTIGDSDAGYNAVFMVFGGTDFSAAIGSFDSANTTGNLSITGLGFSPKAELFANSKPSNIEGPSSVANASLNLGVAKSSSSQYSVASFAESGPTISNTAGGQLSTRCIHRVNATSVTDAISFVSQDADGFTVDRITTSANIKYYYIAFGGSIQTAIPTLAQPSSTGLQTVTTGFQSVGVLAMGWCKAGTGFSADARVSLGFASGPAAGTQGSIATADIDNLDDTNSMGTAWEQFLATIQPKPHPTVGLDFVTQALFESHLSTGFRVNWVLVDATAREHFFLAIGPTVTTVHEPGWVIGSTLQLIRPSRLTADPQITVAHLLQVDTAVFGTPPLVNDVLGHDRLASELGFAAARYRNARSEGLNALSVTETLADGGGLTTPLSQTSTTATAGGETGWSGTLLPWDSQLPTGDWTHTGDITTTDLTSLEVNAADTGYTLLAANLSLTPIADVVASTGNADRHFESGDSVRVTASILDTGTLVRGAPSIVLCTVLRHDVTNNRIQFLNSDTDNTSAAWTTWAAAAAVTTFSLAVTPGDARLFFKTFAATGGWTSDIVVLIQVIVSGVKYYALRRLEEAGSNNQHDGYSLDAVGLALSGKLGFK